MNKITLHLNTKRTSHLAKNFIDTISSCLWNVSCAGIREAKGLDYESYNIFSIDNARKLNVLEILRSDRWFSELLVFWPFPGYRKWKNICDKKVRNVALQRRNISKDMRLLPLVKVAKWKSTRNPTYTMWKKQTQSSNFTSNNTCLIYFKLLPGASSGLALICIFLREHFCHLHT